ncbi:MAG: RidA family protein [Mangrovicoccus sp.]|nr:RidA family protein [Mangrovicoccus sp.]
MRKNFSSGSPLEPVIGFSRAVRMGQHLAVGGTAPIAAEGGTACVGDMAGQTRRCMEIILATAAEAGAKPEDCVRTRILVTDIDLWREAADVHGEIFGEIRPVTTVAAVSGFVNPDWLIEIEADFILS